MFKNTDVTPLNIYYQLYLIILKIKPFSSGKYNVNYHITCGQVMQNITLKECERTHIKSLYPKQQVYLSQSLKTKYALKNRF